MGIGAAIGVGAAAGLGGALISGSAAESAAGTESSAANEASERALQEYQQTEQNLSPFLNAGTSATQSLESALGLPGSNGAANPLTSAGLSGLTFQPTEAQLESTPGYQFDLTQGLQSTQNANAATGTGVSGAALKAAASYATGLANNTLTTQQGIFQSNLGNVLNPLESLATTGENAGAQIGSQGVQAISNANSLTVGGANATAAGTVGAANAASSALSSVGNTPLNYLLYSQLLNPSGGSGIDSGSYDVP